MTCHSCNYKLEPNETVCPHCGEPVKRKNPLIPIVLIFILTLAAILGISLLIPEDPAEGFKKEFSKCMKQEDYRTAIAVCENYSVLRGTKDYDAAVNNVTSHYKSTAMHYYYAVITYVTTQQENGITSVSELEGYDPDDTSIDPQMFAEYLEEEDIFLMGRTRVCCTKLTDGFPEEFEVTLRICGTNIYCPERPVSENAETEDLNAFPLPLE